MTSTPTQGVSFRELVANAHDANLLPFLEESTHRLLHLLDPGLMAGAGLKALVLGARSAQDYLLDPQTRPHVLRLLSRGEAKELCRLLGLKTALPIDSLSAAKLPTLLCFFGVTSLDHEPHAHAAAAVTPLEPQYALFEHQRDALRRLIGRLYRPPRRAVLHMPTGAGKTRTAMHLVARHLLETEPTVVVWLAFSSELLEQAASEFERAWSVLGDRVLPVIRFWGGRQYDLLSLTDGLVIAGLGKLHTVSLTDGNFIPSFADGVSLTVIDEAHQAIAPTYAALLNTLSAKRPGAALLGLTATPGRTYSDIAKDEVLSGFFGRNKVTLKIPGNDNPIRFLIDEGYLARPVFRRLDVESTLHLTAKTRADLAVALDLPDSILAQLIGDDQRNIGIIREVESLLGRHRRVLVFATTKGHAVTLAAVARARGHAAEAVTGETPESERQSILQRYTSNEPTPIALFNYGVLTTGFDAPTTSAVLIARPTRSLVLFSQMVGRAIRGPRAGGNESAEVVSVVDLSLPGFDDPAKAFMNWEDVWQ